MVSLPVAELPLYVNETVITEVRPLPLDVVQLSVDVQVEESRLLVQPGPPSAGPELLPPPVIVSFPLRVSF